MIPVRIAGTTHTMKAPKNWDEQKDGKCVDLHVRVEDGCCLSAWEPTPAELEMLNRGGKVVLSVVGGQPPVWLSVEPNK